jgi:lipopolysaccharide export system protein LptA
MKKLALALLAGTVLASSVYAKDNPLKSRRNSDPIEVTSDTLEVFQEENRAVFTGHVVAIQKDVRLKADQMTVYYRAQEEAKPGGGKEQPKPQAKKAVPEQEKNAIEKIEAIGSVFLSTPEETASGAKGTYDVQNNTIYLDNSVVLTRGQNVLKGEHLTYSFATGQSKLSSNPADKAAGSTESVPGQGKQRVRALFVPEQNQGVTKDKK